MNQNPPLPSKTRSLARDLRKAPTDAERKLWYHLRAGRLNDHKFRRQHPIPPYVIDFYCVANKLAVELDGSQHNQDVDAVRTRYLQAQGIKVLRFWDNEVLKNSEQVLQSILDVVENPTLTPTPLPAGEGLKGEAK